MRVIVTGSSGQLGKIIAARLSAEHEVIGLDQSPGELTTHIGKVEDRELIFRLVKGAHAVIHTASLHAPHVARFTKEQFVQVNIKGALNLLEASIEHQVQKFIYTSTTSIYGDAMTPTDRAVWVTEELVPQPRDIYDITKLAAENLCRHFAAVFALPVICLRTSRFWNEAPHLKTIYRLYRGVDVRDAAEAHLLALNNSDIRFDVFNVSAQSPFTESETADLLRDAGAVIRNHYPEAEEIFRRRGWRLPERIDRVYDIARAVRMLGYNPRHNFREFLTHQ